MIIGIQMNHAALFWFTNWAAEHSMNASTRVCLWHLADIDADDEHVCFGVPCCRQKAVCEISKTLHNFEPPASDEEIYARSAERFRSAAT
jgi:hypothetical protein